jgi:hypothetical protein
MRKIRTSGLMSGEWKRSFDIVDITAPLLDSTIRGKKIGNALIFSSEIQKVCTTARDSTSFPFAVIRGGGWAGSSIFKRLSSSLSSFSGWV